MTALGVPAEVTAVRYEIVWRTARSKDEYHGPCVRRHSRQQARSRRCAWHEHRRLDHFAYNALREDLLAHLGKHATVHRCKHGRLASPREVRAPWAARLHGWKRLPRALSPVISAVKANLVQPRRLP